MRVQVIRVEALHLRGRATLMAAPAGAAGARLRRAVLDDARRLEKESVPWATAFASLLRAGVAAREGDQAAADALLASAIPHFAALDMQLWANAARHARRDRREADVWMARQHIQCPERIVPVLVPGF
jgi:pimeloyl-ACP methyl ester carboxylesterase